MTRQYAADRPSSWSNNPIGSTIILTCRGRKSPGPDVPSPRLPFGFTGVAGDRTFLSDQFKPGRRSCIEITHEATICGAWDDQREAWVMRRMYRMAVMAPRAEVSHLGQTNRVYGGEKTVLVARSCAVRSVTNQDRSVWRRMQTHQDNADAAPIHVCRVGG